MSVTPVLKEASFRAQPSVPPLHQGGHTAHKRSRTADTEAVYKTYKRASPPFAEKLMFQTFGRSGLQRLTACALLALLSTPSMAQSGVDDQYRLGLYQRETGQPYASIETLESLLAANPTLNRARLELAVAYHRTLDYARARA